MKEKELNARVQHKHDIEANWDKAINFIPKAGEIIVYDIDEKYNYSRVKIGDGITSVVNLNFVGSEKANIEEVPKIQFVIWGADD